MSMCDGTGKYCNAANSREEQPFEQRIFPPEGPSREGGRGHPAPAKGFKRVISNQYMWEYIENAG